MDSDKMKMMILFICYIIFCELYAILVRPHFHRVILVYAFHVQFQHDPTGFPRTLNYSVGSAEMGDIFSARERGGAAEVIVDQADELAFT